MKNVTERRIVRYADGVRLELDDVVVTEQPVTIVLNGEEFATLVCSPEYIEDMVVGFLASEGVLPSCSDLRSLSYDGNGGYAYAEIERLSPFRAGTHSKRYIGSCCGKSRQGFYFWGDARTAKRIETRLARLTPDDCFRLMASMNSGSDTFQGTGGVHNAALCDRSGVLLARMDIGRHNALDKIYGHCLRHRVPLEGTALAFSGRISSEILLKVAKIGCEIVLSKSAPTELALELAETLGITTVGFIRGRSLNVYTHPERILFDD